MAAVEKLFTCPGASVQLDPHADDSGKAAVGENPDAARDDRRCEGPNY